LPSYLTDLARAYAELDHFDDAWRCIGEAITAVETTKETPREAEVNCVAGEIALLSSEGDEARAQAYFERALAVARQQKAKSWELRAAMSMARLWRDQGKAREARELLAPVHARGRCQASIASRDRARNRCGSSARTASRQA
jgi:tetratricopeptide (TPR) repeat protein